MYISKPHIKLLKLVLECAGVCTGCWKKFQKLTIEGWGLFSIQEYLVFYMVYTVVAIRGQGKGIVPPGAIKSASCWQKLWIKDYIQTFYNK